MYLILNCVSLVLILTVVTQCWVIEARSLNKNADCKDPSEDELIRKWGEGRLLVSKINYLKTFHHKIEEVAEKLKIKVFEYHDSPALFASFKESTKLNLTRANQEILYSQCDFAYTFKSREHRIPKNLIESKCLFSNKKSKLNSHDECPNIDNNILQEVYKCTQTFKYELALERGVCKDNVYEWETGNY